MVTAADGAPSYYTLENNAARSEDAATAIDLDRKTLHCWLGHPAHFVFDNSTGESFFWGWLWFHKPSHSNWPEDSKHITSSPILCLDFEGKLQRVVNRISKLVGLPSNLSRRSAKFLLRSVPNPHEFPEEVKCHSFEVEKVSPSLIDILDIVALNILWSLGLPCKPRYWNWRRSVQLHSQTNNHWQGWKKSRHSLPDHDCSADCRRGTNRAKEVRCKRSFFLLGVHLSCFVRIITAREYNTAYKSRDLSRHIIVQKRISFLYKLQSFTVHVRENDRKRLWICVIVECGGPHCFPSNSFFDWRNMSSRQMGFAFSMLRLRQIQVIQGRLYVICSCRHSWISTGGFKELWMKRN